MDTAKREKEIEERLLKKKEVVEKETKKSYSSIFGGAKPVDTAKKEREIEERLLRQQKETQKEPSPAKSDGDTTGSSSEEQVGKDTERRRKGSDHDEDRVDKSSDRRRSLQKQIRQKNGRPGREHNDRPRDEPMAPTRWPLARIDGKVCVVTIKTARVVQYVPDQW